MRLQCGGVDCSGAWIITGGTQTGVMQFVGEAARDYMLQSGNYEQQLVVIGIAVLGRIANREAIKNGSFSIDDVETVRCSTTSQHPTCKHCCIVDRMFSSVLLLVTHLYLIMVWKNCIGLYRELTVVFTRPAF